MYLQRVQENIQSGTSSGIESMPAFFVNGVLHDVSFGLEHLQQSIEDELRRLRKNKPRA
jgi:protein-disulfide isomerase